MFKNIIKFIKISIPNYQLYKIYQILYTLSVIPTAQNFRLNEVITTIEISNN